MIFSGGGVVRHPVENLIIPDWRLLQINCFCFCGDEKSFYRG